MTDSDRIAALERRVAELENNAKLVNHPTWLIPTSQSIPIRHWTDTTTPIRTDEVTCDFNPPSLDHNPTR